MKPERETEIREILTRYSARDQSENFFSRMHLIGAAADCSVELLAALDATIAILRQAERAYDAWLKDDKLDLLDGAIEQIEFVERALEALGQTPIVIEVPS